MYYVPKGFKIDLIIINTHSTDPDMILLDLLYLCVGIDAEIVCVYRCTTSQISVGTNV